MSIATQLQAYEDGLSDAYDMVAQRGGTIPAQKNMNNLDAAIATIPSGGGGVQGIPRDVTNGVYGAPTSATTWALPSNATALDYYAIAYAFTNSANAQLTPNITAVSFPNSFTAGDYSAFQAFMGCSSLTSLDISGLTSAGSNSFAGAFQSTGITDFTADNLTTITGSSAFANCCDGCTHLTNASMKNLTGVDYTYGLYMAFANCTNLVSADFGSLETAIGQNTVRSLFQDCSNLATIDFGKLKTINGSMTAYFMFARCTSLTSVDLSSLETINGSQAASYMFSGCTSLTSVDVSGLETINGSQAASYMFSGTSLTSVTFDSLNTLLGATALSRAFYNCTSLTTLSFPALTQNSFGSATNQFNNMLQGCSNVTVHFPAAVKTKIQNWSSVTSGFGGTNTTVLYDL